MAQEIVKKRLQQKRKLQGTVVSTKMEKTITVRVDRKIKHPKYGKFYAVSKKFKAHDEKDMAKMGDVVEIAEARPLSADKRWVYVRTVKAAQE
ncbi:30S ribosomal protein S17 [Candidatus Uhrbacteria bacterium]|nr:30S ribosomal protein S17 [Candidatus Uhrbacteria bacterium]